MNRYLASKYVEVVHRLLVGVEVRDAARRQRVAQRLDVVLEPPKPWPLPPDIDRFLTSLLERGRHLQDTWPRLERHASCLFALRFRPGIGQEVDLRVVDPAQRFVPRRVRVPLVALGTPPSLSGLDRAPLSRRSRVLDLYPGADYPLSESVTGLRGRAVITTGVPPKEVAARWPRVEALDANGAVVGVAHGDQYGEFLLLLRPEATDRLATLPAILTLTVRVTGRNPAPAPPSALYGRADPFWDIPLETAGPPGSVPDDVMAGTAPIPAYTATASRAVTFTFGVLIGASVAPFELT